MPDPLAQFDALMLAELDSEEQRAIGDVLKVESEAAKVGMLPSSRRVVQTHFVLGQAVARFATTIESKWKTYMQPRLSTLSDTDRETYVNAPLKALDACAARMEGIASSRQRPTFQMKLDLPHIGDVTSRERRRLENELKLFVTTPMPSPTSNINVTTDGPNSRVAVGAGNASRPLSESEPPAHQGMLHSAETSPKGRTPSGAKRMDKLATSSDRPEGWLTPVEARQAAARYTRLKEERAGEELLNRIAAGLIRLAVLDVTFVRGPGTNAINASSPLLIPASYWQHRKVPALDFWAGSAAFDVPDPASGVPQEFEYFGIVLDPADVYRQFPVTHGMAPQLPAQEHGPVFALREDGVIDLAPAEALDAAGNNVALLRQLHPSLTSAARELVEALGAGNVPYSALSDRARAYLAAIDKPLAEIVFGQLYVEGVRLQNAATASATEVSRGELPPMAPALAEQLESVLTVNGTFVTNTADGASLLAAEECYRRRPEEERAYREAAVELGEVLLKHPEAIDPAAARLVRDAAQEMGAGNNPQRSAVVSQTTVRNAAITLVGVGTILAAPLAIGALVGGVAGTIVGGAVGAVVAWPLHEALKQTKGVKAINAALAKGFDTFTEETVPGLFDNGKRLIGTQLAVVKEAEPALRRLAKAAPSLAWLDKALDRLAGR